MMILPGAEDVCKDIDECSLKPDICEQGCTNYPGGFDCVCSAGFVVSPDDRTKCLSAGCPPLEPPEFGELNCSPGSPVEGSVCLLECQQGYVRLGKQRRKCLEGGTWEEGSGWCQKISCPPLDLLDHVRASPSDCTASEQNFKTKCRLSCPQGFSFQGSRAAFCGKRGKWVFRNGPTRCIEEIGPQYSQIPPTDPPLVQTTPLPSPSPYIVCPPDISLNMTGPPPLLVQLPRPRTNVDWALDVASHPADAKSLSYYQGPGRMEVRFEAVNRVTRETASCKFLVTVEDVSPPVVTYCPQSKSVFLEPGKVLSKGGV